MNALNLHHGLFSLIMKMKQKQKVLRVRPPGLLYRPKARNSHSDFIYRPNRSHSLMVVIVLDLQ